MLAEPTPLHREVLGAIRYQPNVAQLHTDERLLPRTEAARASWNYQRRDDGRVLVTYDMTRLQRLDLDKLDHREAPLDHREAPLDHREAPRFLVSLGAQDVVDPSTVIATMRYAHPVYTPASVAAQARLPQLNTRRVAFAGAYHGWGFHEDGALSGRRAAEAVGGRWTSVDGPPRLAPTPCIYATEIKHARVEPVRNIFSYRSHTWLVDLDDLPRYSGVFAPLLRPLASFQARDHVGDPDRSLRENIDGFLAEHDIDLQGGRIQMLAHPRTLGYVFNPISVFWCHRPDGELAAVVVEVHNTYGGRHAYLVRPDRHGRSSVDKELYVSPFNDTSGAYHVAVPLPGETVTVGVTLHREGRPPFTATLKGTGRPATPRAVVSTSLRTPLAPLLGMVRIKYQGIKLWLRGLAVQPRPNHQGEAT
jgi:DUF1365 family protein